MDVLAIAILIVAYFLKSAFWMGALGFTMSILLGHVYENREDDSLKKWQRNALYTLLITGICLTFSISNHNAKMNRMSECKEVCHTIN